MDEDEPERNQHRNFLAWCASEPQVDGAVFPSARSTTMRYRTSLAVALTFSAVLAGGAAAQKSTTSDAEIESNVLKAMAADSRLATQQIQASTAFGAVTLSGSVPDEATRNAAEQVVAHTHGVKKVVDQITVATAAAYPAAPENGTGPDTLTANEQAGMDAISEANGNDPRPRNTPLSTPQQPPNFPQQASQAYPQQGYPQQPPYASNNGYGYGQPQPRLYRRDWERQQGYANQAPYGYAPQQGQPGGQPVTIASGVVLPVRITRWISSGDAQPGSTFTAVVENDVLANGLIAIPRGAEVQGNVVDAHGAGALKGRGSLTLQLTTLHLGGQVIPMQSQTFTVNGRDKAAQSVNATLGGAAIGALFGAVVGRGTGAAIGAGVGGAAGLGASAISDGGNAHLPAEALLQFQLTAPVNLVTVSEMEMQRLGNYAGPEGSRRPLSPQRGYYGGYAYPAPYPYPYAYYGRPYRGYYGGYYGW